MFLLWIIDLRQTSRLRQTPAFLCRCINKNPETPEALGRLWERFFLPKVDLMGVFCRLHFIVTLFGSELKTHLLEDTEQSIDVGTYVRPVWTLCWVWKVRLGLYLPYMVLSTFPEEHLREGRNVDKVCWCPTFTRALKSSPSKDLICNVWQNNWTVVQP